MENIEESLKKNKSGIETYSWLIGSFVAICTLILGIWTLMNSNEKSNVELKTKTYESIDSLVSDKYQDIAKYMVVLKRASKDEEHEVAMTELPILLSEFTDDVNTCVKVGACDTLVARTYLCTNRKVSGVIHLSKGMAKMNFASLEFLELISDDNPYRDTLIDTSVATTSIIQNLSSIFGIRQSEVLEDEICNDYRVSE
ncbi:TPA: hypothetical protein ACVOZE_003998 [Vibrio diabolicus]